MRTVLNSAESTCPICENVVTKRCGSAAGLLACLPAAGSRGMGSIHMSQCCSLSMDLCAAMSRAPMCTRMPLLSRSSSPTLMPGPCSTQDCWFACSCSNCAEQPTQASLTLWQEVSSSLLCAAAAVWPEPRSHHGCGPGSHQVCRAAEQPSLSAQRGGACTGETLLHIGLILTITSWAPRHWQITAYVAQPICESAEPDWLVKLCAVRSAGSCSLRLQVQVLPPAALTCRYKTRSRRAAARSCARFMRLSRRCCSHLPCQLCRSCGIIGAPDRDPDGPPSAELFEVTEMSILN